MTLLMLFKRKMAQEKQEVLGFISQSAAAYNLDVKTREFSLFWNLHPSTPILKYMS